MIIDQLNSTTRLYKIQAMVIYSFAILVAVKEGYLKTWIEILANIADPN